MKIYFQLRPLYYSYTSYSYLLMCWILSSLISLSSPSLATPLLSPDPSTSPHSSPSSKPSPIIESTLKSLSTFSKQQSTHSKNKQWKETIDHWSKSIKSGKKEHIKKEITSLFGSLTRGEWKRLMHRVSSMPPEEREAIYALTLKAVSVVFGDEFFWVPFAIEAIYKSSPYVQSVAWDILDFAQKKYEANHELLKEIELKMKSETARVRAISIRLWSKIAPKGAAGWRFVIKSLSDPAKEVRAVAIQSLVKLKGYVLKWTPQLIETLKNGGELGLQSMRSLMKTLKDKGIDLEGTLLKLKWLIPQSIQDRLGWSK